MSNLALLGGPKTRTKPFVNLPHIDELERKYVNDCLDQKTFSRFIGSPLGDYRKNLAATSAEAVEHTDFWSVLGGPYVRKFEAEFARKHEVKYAVSSNGATSSLISAVIACGIKPGEEVITTPFTFTATATAIRIAGAKVVFADIDPETFCITAESVRKRITAKTKAVVVVHILGNAGDVVNIKKLCDEKGLILIEDSAQALHSRKDGKYLGTHGAVGCFSFQETKNIMTGEGGMAITNDPKIAYKLRLVRNHGEAMVYDGVDAPDVIEAAIGYNFRLQEPLAALGYAQIQKMEMLNAIRRENFVYLRKELAQFDFLKVIKFTNDEKELTPHIAGMTYRHDRIHRNTFVEAVRAEGVPVTIGYPRLLNENPLTREDSSHTPNAKVFLEERYLGIFPIAYPNTTDDMRDVIRAFEKVAGNFKELEAVNINYVQRKEFNSGRG